MTSLNVRPFFASLLVAIFWSIRLASVSGPKATSSDMLNKMNDNGAGPTDAGTDVRKREKEMEREREGERERIMKQMCGGNVILT